MSILSDLRFRMRALFQRRAMDGELEDELRFHFEKEVEKHRAAGLAEEEARRQARLAFGGQSQVAEDCREARGTALLESVLQDVRYSLRQMKRSPGFAATVVLTLALGIGTTTAIFSLVESFLLRPLPYPHANRLVMVWEQLRALGIRQFPAPVGDFVDYRDQNRVFDAMAAVENAHFTLGGGQYPERIYGVRVTANLFPMMGLHAALGRVLTAEDNQPGHAHVAVLSSGLWKERFGGDQTVLGRNVVLDGTSYEVVGVLAQSARFSIGYPETPRVWTPLPLVPDPGRRIGELDIAARLRPGVTLATARAQMNRLAAKLERVYHIETGPHGENPGYGVVVTPLRQELTGNLRDPLLLMFAATALIFLIACANIANLMLTRGICREREFAVRISLGAGWGRLARMLVVESLVLAVAGAGVGIGIATAVSGLLVRLSPYKEATLLGHSIDAPVLGCAAALGLIAVMLFGLASALMILRQGRRGLPAGIGHQIVSARHSQVLRRVLVVAETAMAVALTIGAGMLIHSFLRVSEINLGFEPQGLLTAEVNLPPSYSTGVMQREFYQGLLRRLRSKPGVESAAASNMLPAADRQRHNPFSVQGRPWRPIGADRAPQFTNNQAVSIDYFRSMGIALRAGRLFSLDDFDGAQRVAIVNETMVRGFWPGENPIGKHLMLGDSASPAPPWLTIVGVVADVRSGGPTAQVLPELYTPIAQTPVSAMALVVRTKGKIGDGRAAQLTGDLRTAVRAMDRGIPVENVATYDELLAGMLAPRRFEMLLLTAFGMLALVLAAVGLYGVVSYAVTQRAREIGLRIALGASRGDVVEMILGQALWLAACGIGVGTALAWIFRHVLASAIFGIGLVDFPVYFGVTLLLLGIALAAALLPARRAARVDPMEALRSE
jgi:putative ABC transport system permease protein